MALTELDEGGEFSIASVPKRAEFDGAIVFAREPRQAEIPSGEVANGFECGSHSRRQIRALDKVPIEVQKQVKRCNRRSRLCARAGIEIPFIHNRLRPEFCADHPGNFREIATVSTENWNLH